MVPSTIRSQTEPHARNTRMTNRERIIKTLLCQQTDRAPWGIGLGFSPWAETMERWKKESGIADLDLARYFGYDADFRSVPAEMGPLPHFDYQVIREDADFVVAVDWRGITMRNRRDSHSIPEFIAHPIKTEDDWERYKAQRLPLRLDERLAKLDEFIEGIRGADVPVQAGYFPWGVFGTARDLLGAEEILIGFYTMPDVIRDIMQTCTDLWLAIFERIAQRVQIDHIHIWEDMAGKQGSLISMQMVEDFMMPHYDRLADFARRHNVAVMSVDSDGLVDELVPVMMKHGVNAYLPFEVQAGNDVEVYRARYPKLGIIGGVDKNAIARTKKDINAQLDRVERMLAKGGFIPGCDHLIPPNVPWDNWVYYNQNLRKIIGA